MNPESAIKNALKTVMTDEVAAKYTWTGRKNTAKISHYVIIDVIIGNCSFYIHRSRFSKENLICYKHMHIL